MRCRSLVAVLVAAAFGWSPSASAGPLDEVVEAVVEVREQLNFHLGDLLPDDTDLPTEWPCVNLDRDPPVSAPPCGD